MKLTVKRMSDEINTYDFDGAFDPENIKGEWAQLETAVIGDYPWKKDYPYTCEAAAKIGWNKNGLQVLMYARENPIICEETHFGGMPCLDSCMEFFFSPFADDRYYNIEINPAGIAHVAVGVRGKRYVYNREVPGMKITASVYDGKTWAISFNVPESFIYTHFGKCFKAGDTITGNFFKCSGRNLHDHYGVWNHVGTEHPDYHRPEYFGEMVIG